MQYNAATGSTTVVNHVRYDTFGQIVSQTNSQFQPWFAYTGREWDPAAGFYFYRARWYDPRAGRFLSEDPLGFAAGDVNLSRYVGNGATLWVDPSGMAWGWGAAVAGGAIGGAVSGVICVGGSLLFDGELPTQGKLAGAVTSGFVSGGIAAGFASGDPTFIGAVAIGATAGGLGAVAGSVLEQGIDHGKVDPGKVIHDGVIGAAGGLIGAGLGKAIGGSVGNGSLRVPTGMAPAINLNGTLTYVLTHTDIQQKALVMAGVMAAATQLTAQAARGLAMAVQGGFNGADPPTEMAAKEADNVVAPHRKAFAKTADGEYWVAKHKDFTPRAPDIRSHHGVMSAWMEKHFPGYKAGEAPTVHMPTGQHYNTYGVYNKWRAGIVNRAGSFDWSKVTEADIRALSEQMFDAANVPKQVREMDWQDFDRMLKAFTEGRAK